MNKKQLVVAWIFAILFSVVAYTNPWEDVLRIGLSTIMIGVLLIYTLRDKKK